MSRLDTVWIDPCSVFALGRDHFLGRKEHGTTDTANTFSTSGYLIISVATRSLMTPITYLAHRSGTYCVKSNVLPDNLTQKGHRKERDARRWSSTTITGSIFRWIQTCVALLCILYYPRNDIFQILICTLGIGSS